MKHRMTAVARLVCTTALVALAPACVVASSYHPLTAAQLAERGTRRYSDVTRDKATAASATALTTLGYDVTIADPDAGIVKTAPRTVQVSAVGGAGYADAVEDGLAWSISVEQSGKDVVVHCVPRGFRNGSEMHDKDMWVAEAIDGKFTDFWSELEGTLHRKIASR